ncbi:sensor histidine kinase [Shewanella cyperi]|uniref:sensor histidine kinase n=1 Tax=Shewanella cyperi TaxID=2814292 RepID=UPI001A943D44|nr:ATP-binding protein [Shewanella cyperi]QSX40050.1 PAS domain-containing protein [Shewanella cyperi]
MLNAVGLKGRLLLSLLCGWLLGIGLILGLETWLGQGWHWVGLGVGMLLSLWFSALLISPLGDALKAMELGLLNLIDNDFSVSLPVGRGGELGRLSALFNQASAALRKERQHIYQRELLLDKVIQNSPNLMLLLDGSGHIIYANDAARHQFNQGKPLNGMLFQELLQQQRDDIRAMLQSPTDGLFSLGEAGSDAETWHLSRGQFNLNGEQHQLLLLKQMTRELSRQEVAVWKKVIRVISHELNNSLAPISSMVNSGRMLAGQLAEPRLNIIFDTIDKRTRHLSEFIEGYARFARLPRPIKAQVDLAQLCRELRLQCLFNIEGELPDLPLWADEVQLEQVLLNLLKNAAESGSDPEHIVIHARRARLGGQGMADEVGLEIEVLDRGPGMSPEVLSQALLPFYSTKQQGTGLGLALCREIIEAHDGRISLQNREGGGLSVRLFLPSAGA